MKNKNKKMILSVCAVSMAVSMMLAGCGNAESTTADSAAADTTASESAPAGESAITDGYYKTEISGLSCFVHFGEDGTYYANYFDGGVTEAGTYTVEDKSMDYYETYNDGTADESSKKTAAQVIVLNNYNGSTQEIAFDGDRLCDFTAGGMSSHVFMDHDAAFNYVAADMEPAIVVQVLYANNDSGMSLTLYHDRSFVDYTGDSRVAGTWAPANGGYTLTTEDGNEYTLTMDGNNATYIKDGNDVPLTAGISTGSVSAEFTSAEPVGVTGIPGMEGATDCDVALRAYDDGTAEVVVTVFGNEVVADKGSYTLDASGPIPAFAFTFDAAGELASEPDYASATETSIVLNLNYACTDAACTAEIGGNSIDLALTMEAPLNFTYTLG